jgi:hypothetical protein
LVIRNLTPSSAELKGTLRALGEESPTFARPERPARGARTDRRHGVSLLAL